MSDYEMEQRTLLYRDEISRAEIENIVRQRHLKIPLSTGGNVIQALWTSGQDNSGSGRNQINRKTRNKNSSSNRRDSSNSSNRGNSSHSCNNSNNSNNSSNSSNSSNIPQSAYDLVRAKCIRCLEPGHRWRECTAYVLPVVGTTGNRQNKHIENVSWLASVLLGTSVGSSKENPSKNTADKWVVDSGATYHMTRSADMMHGIRPTSDKVRISDSRVIDIVGYGTLTVVFPGSLTVKLLDVTYVPALSCNLFSLMAARRRGVGFRTAESGMCISLFDGRLRFEGDGSSYSGFSCRIEPNDDCCVLLPNVPPNVTPNSLAETPHPPVNHGDVERDLPQTFPFVFVAPDSDGSSENAVDAVREF